MRAFGEIIAMAASRKGGLPALEEALAATPVRPAAEVAELPDDRVLAEMTRRIFRAGFSAAVIEAKWPGFEAAFRGFEPHACAFMSDEDVDALTRDRGIVRNGAKIRAVRHNARLVLDLAAAHGSAARFLAAWPDTDCVGLLRILKERGSHLGGDSGMRLLRAIGKPAFVTTRDVVAALIREGVLDRAPSSRRDFAAVQDAFNHWSATSGRDLTAVSRILAMSVADEEAPGGPDP